MLVELTLARRVDLAGEAEAVRRGRVVVRDTGTTADALLDEALARLARKQGTKPADVVPGLGKGLRDQLYGRLVERGLLRAESGRVLGILPTHRWPTNDAAHENEIRASLARALQAGATADARVAALVSLLHALDVVPKVLEPASVGLGKKELKGNAKKVAEGS